MNIQKIVLRSIELNKLLEVKIQNLPAQLHYNPYSEDVDSQESIPSNTKDTKQRNCIETFPYIYLL